MQGFGVDIVVAPLQATIVYLEFGVSRKTYDIQRSSSSTSVLQASQLACYTAWERMKGLSGRYPFNATRLRYALAWSASATQPQSLSCYLLSVPSRPSEGLLLFARMPLSAYVNHRNTWKQGPPTD
ncbi:hypothetical protein C8Q70DRAFT_627409 [Cubamyces menziesii]|nr:hypothetical protein C8Q70DRAFT_627409 [Cubamyces menziesii]